MNNFDEDVVSKILSKKLADALEEDKTLLFDLIVNKNKGLIVQGIGNALNSSINHVLSNEIHGYIKNEIQSYISKNIKTISIDLINKCIESEKDFMKNQLAISINNKISKQSYFSVDFSQKDPIVNKNHKDNISRKKIKEIMNNFDNSKPLKKKRTVKKK